MSDANTCVHSRTYAVTNVYAGRFIDPSINTRRVWSADQILTTTDCTRRYHCVLSVTCISWHRLPYKELVSWFTVCAAVFFAATTTWQYLISMRSALKRVLLRSARPGYIDLLLHLQTSRVFLSCDFERSHKLKKKLSSITTDIHKTWRWICGMSRMQALFLL